MTFKIEPGNLLELLENDEIDVLIHSCNCFQTIGKRSASGIAAAIGQAYEEVVQADLTYTEGDINQLGKFILIPVTTKSGKTKHIVNLYSQYLYGGMYGTPTSYLAMSKGLSNLSYVLPTALGKDIRIGTYQLGCNRGGGDPNLVMPIIANALKNFNVRIIV